MYGSSVGHIGINSLCYRLSASPILQETQIVGCLITITSFLYAFMVSKVLLVVATSSIDCLLRPSPAGYPSRWVFLQYDQHIAYYYDHGGGDVTNQNIVFHWLIALPILQEKQIIGRRLGLTRTMHIVIHGMALSSITLSSISMT